MARTKEIPITYHTTVCSRKRPDIEIDLEDMTEEFKGMICYMTGKRMAEAVGGRLIHPNEKYEKMYEKFSNDPYISLQQGRKEKYEKKSSKSS